MNADEHKVAILHEASRIRREYGPKEWYAQIFSVAPYLAEELGMALTVVEVLLAAGLGQS